MDTGAGARFEGLWPGPCVISIPAGRVDEDGVGGLRHVVHVDVWLLPRHHPSVIRKEDALSLQGPGVRHVVTHVMFASACARKHGRQMQKRASARHARAGWRHTDLDLILSRGGVGFACMCVHVYISIHMSMDLILSRGGVGFADVALVNQHVID